MSKVLHLPRKLHFEVKPLGSLGPVTESRLWSSFREVTTMCENARGTTTRAQSLEAPETWRACAVEMRIDDVERHECTATSSELAGHARALQ